MSGILIAMGACSNQVEQPSPITSTAISASAVEGTEATEALLRQPIDLNRFYDARVATDSGIFSSWYFGWNRDGSFWIPDLNTIRVIDRDNHLIKTITLDEDKLPPVYDLTLYENRILAIGNQSRDSWHEYGAVYQAGGKISLCGISLWDTEGNLVKEYPSIPLSSDEEGYLTTTPDGTTIDWRRGLYDGNVHWLDDHTLALDAHSRVIIYDLDSDTGRVVDDDMAELIEARGKFGGYYGVAFNSCYVSNGDFYYLSYKNEAKVNTVGTVWRVGKDDEKASVMFEGKEFTHLCMNESTMVLTEKVDKPEYGYNLWWVDARQGILNEIGYYQVNIPIFINGPRISMYSDNSEKYCYDTEKPKESALTVFKPEDPGIGIMFGTHLSSDETLQYIVRVAADNTENAPMSLCVMDAKNGKNTCIYDEGSVYDDFLLSPDESCGVVFSSSNPNGFPQVRVIRLDILE